MLFLAALSVSLSVPGSQLGKESTSPEGPSAARSVPGASSGLRAWHPEGLAVHLGLFPHLFEPQLPHLLNGKTPRPYGATAKMIVDKLRKTHQKTSRWSSG